MILSTLMIRSGGRIGKLRPHSHLLLSRNPDIHLPGLTTTNSICISASSYHGKSSKRVLSSHLIADTNPNGFLSQSMPRSLTSH
jgi:hypothetical protein